MASQTTSGRLTRSGWRARRENGDAARDHAAAVLRAYPYHAASLFRLSRAEQALGNTAAALAALATGAEHIPEKTREFTDESIRMGAWRLPPPRNSAVLNTDKKVAEIRAASRKDFLPYAERGEPVVIRRFSDVSGWSWEALIKNALESEASGEPTEGDVLVTASGVTPDYCYGPGERHASRIETMISHRLCLSQLFQRIIGAEYAPSSHLQPLLCEREKIYSYGKSWMLADARLQERVRSTQPAFLEKADLAPDAERNEGLAASMCWVSSAGCLTPLHYDCSDGLLAQVLGQKRCGPN
jgi:hypothetical protein